MRAGQAARDFDTPARLVPRSQRPPSHFPHSPSLFPHPSLHPSTHTALSPLPTTTQESEALDLASKLEDRAWALETLLGPTMAPEGASNRLKSEEARALTEHLYTHDRYAGGVRGGVFEGVL